MKRRVLVAVLALQMVMGASIAWGAQRIGYLPYTITHAGSYYINENLSTTSDGIIINASDVTIDMRGYTISGNSSSDGDAVRNDANVKNIEISNGTFTNFAGSIDLGNVDAVKLLDLRVTDLSENSSGNGGGVDIGNGGMIKNCIFDHNRRGTSVNRASIVTGNTSLYSGGAGFIGRDDGNIFIGNTVRESAGDGLYSWSASTIKNNTILYVRGNGMWTYDLSVIDGNIIYREVGTGVEINECASCIYGDNVVYNPFY